MTDKEFKDNLIKKLKAKEITLEEALAEVFIYLNKDDGLNQGNGAHKAAKG